MWVLRFVTFYISALEILLLTYLLTYLLLTNVRKLHQPRMWGSHVGLCCAFCSSCTTSAAFSKLRDQLDNLERFKCYFQILRTEID